MQLVIRDASAILWAIHDAGIKRASDRDMLRMCRGLDAERRDEAVAVLLDRGWLRKVADQGPRAAHRPPGQQYKVHPIVHSTRENLRRHMHRESIMPLETVAQYVQKIATKQEELVNMEKQMVEVMMSPDVATQLLRCNSGNRPIRPRHVAVLANEMIEGRWRLTHQAIAITSKGYIVDGQHRLSAVVAAGVTVPMLMDQNADLRTADVIDTGIARTGGDVLAMGGCGVGANRKAALIRTALLGVNYGKKFSNDVIADFAMQHTDAINDAYEHWTKALAPVAGCAMVAMITGEMTHAMINGLGDQYCAMDWAGESSPMCRLRAASDRLARGTSEHRARLYRCTLSALRAARDGRQIGPLKETMMDWAKRPWV